MAEKTITAQLPESAYRKLQKAAELTYRSVDEILVSTIETSLPTMPDVPSELAEELSAMHLLSDDALWAAVSPALSQAKQTRLAQLNQLAHERPLTPAEEAEQNDLVAAYGRSVLRRAQALAILSQRGHPVSLDTLPTPN